MPTFGAWLVAAIVVVGGVAALESWDEQIAWAAAVLLLMAMFFRYPQAFDQIKALLGNPTL